MNCCSCSIWLRLQCIDLDVGKFVQWIYRVINRRCHSNCASHKTEKKINKKNIKTQNERRNQQALWLIFRRKKISKFSWKSHFGYESFFPKIRSNRWKLSNDIFFFEICYLRKKEHKNQNDILESNDKNILLSLEQIAFFLIFSLEKSFYRSLQHNNIDFFLFTFMFRPQQRSEKTHSEIEEIGKK